MVNFTIANPKDDNNRVAGAAVAALDQGDLVTVNPSGEIVAADAADGVSGQAAGALMSPVVDPTAAKYGDLEYVQNQLKEEQNVLVGEGDRVAALTQGVLIEDEDEAGSLNPGEPVYLAEGGGVTATAPATTGSVVQIVGIAQDANSYLLDVQVTDTTA